VRVHRGRGQHLAGGKLSIKVPAKAVMVVALEE
jgi:hypothetical protein